MPEHFEDFENKAVNPGEAEKNLHRNFRPGDQSAEQKQMDTSSMEGDSSADKWIDAGIQNVPLTKIDLSDSNVKGPEDCKKTSYDEMIKEFDVLEKEVRPAVEKGATADYFRTRDRVCGLDHHNSLRIYDAFYGHNSIRLNKIDENNYKVENGYHRLYVAQELSLPTVPARVIEKQF